MSRRHLLFAFLLTLVVASSSHAADRIRIACVGDSITYGAGIVKRAQNSYPAALQKMLGGMYDVRNFGVNGATLLSHGDLPYIKQRAFGDAKKFNPNIVVIMLGSNDTKPQNWKHVTDYTVDYQSLISAFQALAAKPKIFLCLPVPANKGAYGIDDGRVKELQPKIRMLAKKHSLPVIDLYTAMSGKPELFPDQIHPNAAGAKIMAEHVRKAIAGHTK